MLFSEVSVLMPNYNGRALNREAIDSILGRSFANFEIGVVAGGLPEGSADVFRWARGQRVVLD